MKYNTLPKSAMGLYIKIYCQKQSRMKNKKCSLIEATKSWVSLSKAEKQHILSVFNEYKTQMKKHFASNLQNVQLYMKKKHVDPKRLCKSKMQTTDYNQPFETTEFSKGNSYPISSNNGEDNEIDIQHDKEDLENYDTTNLQSVAYVSTEPDLQPNVPKLISEPTPPIRSSMELFEIIKHSEESTRNVNWADLSKLQKQRYQRALLSIKNDYIKKYSTYLEQLTPEELFHYYKSKFS